MNKPLFQSVLKKVIDWVSDQQAAQSVFQWPADYLMVEDRPPLA